MPNKRRSHGQQKPQVPGAKEQNGAAAFPLDVQHSSKSSASYPTVGYSFGKSLQSQATPKPAAQVSTVKPAQFETAPVSQIEARATVHSPAAGLAAVTRPKDTAKVQVEVPAVAVKGAKEAPSVDPFDALASILPSAVSIAPEPSVFTGPEVKEHGVTSEEVGKCGERDDTLPPGYRFEDMAPAPPDVKPKAVPKPLSTDEALDSLSAGFMSSMVSAAPKKQEKTDNVETVSVSAAGPTNFAPPPVKKEPTLLPVAKCPGAPADKKAKMEKVSGEGKEATKPKTDEGSSLSLDALSALGDSLAPDVPKPESPKLRPEDIVSEDKLKKEKGVLVGERDESIPPEYRFDKAKLDKLPAPKLEPTMGNSDALDILSGDFMTSSVAPAVQAPVVAPSAPPAKKAPTVSTVTMSSAPPADKKSKMEKGEDLSVEAGLTASTAKRVESSAPPPAGTKPKASVRMDTTDGKPKTDQCDTLSLDALRALGDTLASDVPKPESPKLRPEDIVSEDKLKKEKGVLVGERDESIPPEYRFDKAKLDKLPAPKLEPTMGNSDALDILSGDFMTSSVAPAVQAPVVAPSAPPAKKAPTVSSVSMSSAPPADKKAKMENHGKRRFISPSADDALDFLSGDFTTSSAAPVIQACPGHDPPAQSKVEDLSALDVRTGDFVALAKASKLQTPVPLPTKKAPEIAVCRLGQPGSPDVPEQAKRVEPKTDKDDSLSLDALSALGDTLAADVPKPESPKLRPEDIVSEDKLNKEKGVLVGVREDSLPPEYRFDKKELERLPAAKPEPTMGTADALDILSGDFTTFSAAPVQACPVRSPSPAQPSADFALDALAGDFVSATTAAPVKSTACAPTETDPQMDAGADCAMDALSDTLMDIKPAPQPAPLPTRDIVKEKKIVEEKLIKMGERDDSLPPEYRPTEEDLKKMAEAKAKAAAAPKKKTMGDDKALDLLSSDFSAAAPKPVAAVKTCAATTKLSPLVLDSEPLKPMAGAVLDSLSSTLLPDDPEFKPKADKPKKHRAEEPPATDLLSAQLSSDVVPTSTNKGGKS